MTKFEKVVSLLTIAQELEEIDPQMADLTDEIAEELIQPGNVNDSEIKFQNTLNDLSENQKNEEINYSPEQIINSATSEVAELMLETNMNFDQMQEEEFKQRLIQTINSLF